MRRLRDEDRARARGLAQEYREHRRELEPLLKETLRRLGHPEFERLLKRNRQFNNEAAALAGCGAEQLADAIEAEEVAA